MANNLKENHKRLSREAVRAVARLQLLMDDDITPEHMKPALLACLELLERGLLYQPMEDERVQIEVVNGRAYVAEQTEYVQVTISDLDNSFEG